MNKSIKMIGTKRSRKEQRMKESKTMVKEGGVKKIEARPEMGKYVRTRELWIQERYKFIRKKEECLQKCRGEYKSKMGRSLRERE